MTIEEFVDPKIGPSEPRRRRRPTAYTLGQNDFLHGMEIKFFKFPELQQEYEAGYNRERRDLQDARY